ncbi:hypothetical protein WICMUC_004345 [Wickerhamomyces mucosus]|uniref:Uncharacterized protein n=1 Tax=Wickerhamomyces mucosus TaxID=1378264 RepID=A0A9P8PIR2_9ASCO|nr:hypothetical protein WICMUC_004345 [Wickerhamomyces mucosus]
MLANGPAWTNTGVPSKVCIIFGLMASFNRAVRAPAAPISSQVIGTPCFDEATTILPNLSLISSNELAKAKIAIHSEATEISNPVFLVNPLSVGASPTVIPLKNLSFISTTLLQVMVSGSISNLTNCEISSSDKSSGLILSIPNFSNLLNIDLVKVLTPFLAGTNLL